MTNLGKCLLFYLKYPAEMERLYAEDAEEPKLEGLPNPDELLEKVRLVCDIASREAAEFLEACVPGIEDHFRSISTAHRVRSNLENTWELKFRVSPKRARKQFSIGIYVDIDRTSLVPWVWSRGARRAESEIVRILGRGAKAATLGYWSGTVGLGEIKIPVSQRLDDPVTAGPLITQLHECFKPFTADTVKAIAAIPNTRGE